MFSLALFYFLLSILDGLTRNLVLKVKQTNSRINLATQLLRRRAGCSTDKQKALFILTVILFYFEDIASYDIFLYTVRGRANRVEKNQKIPLMRQP